MFACSPIRVVSGICPPLWQPGAYWESMPSPLWPIDGGARVGWSLVLFPIAHFQHGRHGLCPLGMRLYDDSALSVLADAWRHSEGWVSYLWHSPHCPLGGRIAGGDVLPSMRGFASIWILHVRTAGPGPVTSHANLAVRASLGRSLAFINRGRLMVSPLLWPWDSPLSGWQVSWSSLYTDYVLYIPITFIGCDYHCTSLSVG